MSINGRVYQRLHINIYDADDAARFVEAMRGSDGDFLIALFGDRATRRATSMQNIHAPNAVHGGRDWIANVKVITLDKPSVT